MSSKVPLSVVILTKNEASRIADCLESVAWADEVLVVDDESSDSTVEIAASMGARVLRRRMDVEGRHRNWAYTQARHEWVLSLDADERVTPECGEEIRYLLGHGPTSDSYAIPRRNFIGKRWIRHGGWYPSAQVKLFKRSVFRWEETTVHPRAISSSDKPWGVLRHDLLHFSYRDLFDFTGKLNRQTTLEAQKWIQDGRRMNLGKALWRTADRFFRTWWFKRGYRDGFPGYWVAVYAGLYQFLSFAKYWHLRQGRVLYPVSYGDKKTGHVDTGDGERSSLSVVILTKDAGTTIQQCLDSVSWADEVLVIDGGSSDDTVSRCERAGARVIRRPATENFGEERNVGIDSAKGDWILQLDADEVVGLEFREALVGVLQRGEPAAAYKFRRRNTFLGHRMRHGGWDHHSLHLFRRGLARYEGRVHERLIVDGPIGVLSVGVDHYPFRTLDEFVDRQNRYTSLEAHQWVESSGRVPMRTFWWQTTVRPMKLWWKIMVKKQGFREGMFGFIFAGLYAFVHLLKWAKAWEILDAQGASG
jgi:glycosyltransferase involved in cell wall biosynthesis